MGARFIGGDREQVFLMPPSVRDWVPEGHLVWTVLEAVGELDLSAFYADYRADGHGRPAYEPSMMVALLLYAYARGNRSARGIERACVEDVAYRVVAGNVAPDHSTIAEFRCRHERALGEVFSRRARALRAGGAGVGRGGGDRRHEDVGQRVDQRQPRLRTDRARDPRRGGGDRSARGRALRHASAATSCPSTCAPARGGARRCARPRNASSASASQATEPADGDGDEEVAVELDPQRFVTRPQGRRAWLREGRRALDAERERQARPIPQERTDRLFEACRRLEQELDVEHASNAAYEAWRARGVAADGSRRMAPGMVKPYQPPVAPTGPGERHRPRLARGPHARPAAAAGLQRADGGQRPAGRDRRRDHDRVTRLRASRTDGPRHPTRAARASSSMIPTSCSPTPATGISARSKQSSATACKCSSRPTPACAKAPVPAGPVASTTSCAACWPRPTGAPSTASARSPSSPCSARSSSTAQIRRFQRRGRVGLQKRMAAHRGDPQPAQAPPPPPRRRPRLRRGRRRRRHVRLAHQIGTSETPPRDFPTASTNRSSGWAPALARCQITRTTVAPCGH